jgi:hypothetical protein
VVDVVVDPPAAAVVVDPPTAVVVVTEWPPAAVVVVAAPPWACEPEDDALGGGRWPLPELVAVALDGPPPVSPLIHIPKMAATTMAVRSCQVFQDRRSLILSSPGWGRSSDGGDGASAVTDGDVTDLASNMASVRPSELSVNTSRNAPAHHQAEIPFDPALMLVARDDCALIS